MQAQFLAPPGGRMDEFPPVNVVDLQLFDFRRRHRCSLRGDKGQGANAVPRPAVFLAAPPTPHYNGETSDPNHKGADMKTIHVRAAGLLLLLTALAAGPAAAADPLPDKLAPYFRPPPDLARDLGGHRSPLLFADGSPVKTAADWQKRRQEILKEWHGLMGPWPELVAKPKVEFLAKERGDGFTNH